MGSVPSQPVSLKLLFSKTRACRSFWLRAEPMFVGRSLLFQYILFNRGPFH